MNQRQQDPIVVEPEVLPPEPDGAGRSGARPGNRPGGAQGRLRLVAIGLLLDALDFITRGPLGIRVGLPAGFIITFLLLGYTGIGMRQRVLYSFAAGVYCLLPGTEVVPLGTLLSTVIRTAG